MHRLRGLRFLALAAVLMSAAGCATAPSSTQATAAATTAAAPAAAASAAHGADATPELTLSVDTPDTATASDAQAQDDNAADLQAALEAADNTNVHYADIWQRVRAGFGIPDMDGPGMQRYVQQAVQWYSTKPDYVARMTMRSRKYLYYILQEVQKRHLPTELALLPFVESAFNPDALSSAQASGMWQFIPSTGKHYHLRQTIFQDGRRDVLASTKAALDYLTKLHDMFGDWQLALAAYNWGEGGLQRAIAYNEAHDLPVDYADLRMPAETRNYYPKLQAVKDIIADPAKYGITLPDVPDHPYFKPVPITQDIDVALAARLAGISVDEFRALNPAYRKPVILAATHPRVLLPYDNATAFEQALTAYSGPLASWTTYTVSRTASPQQLARELHLSEATLRSVNTIPGRILIKAGSTLLVPRPPQDDRNVSARVAENAMLALAPVPPAGRRVRLRAWRGDTPRSVARRYHLSPLEVAHWNHMREGERFRPRALLVVYLPQRHIERARHERVATRDHRPREVARNHHERRLTVAQRREELAARRREELAARRREQLAARRRAVRVAERERHAHHGTLHVRGATRQDISVAQR